MSRIVVVYFSGTGNTAWVVQRLAESLIGLGDTVQTFFLQRDRAAGCRDNTR